MKPRCGVSLVMGDPHMSMAIMPEVPQVPVSSKCVSLLTTPMSVLRSSRSESASCRLVRRVSRDRALLKK